MIRAHFAGWTGGGSVRQASYKGLDAGKDARLVIRNSPGSCRRPDGIRFEQVGRAC